MFSIGDVIRSAKQVTAPERLVLERTDDPDVVVVFEPSTNVYLKVICSRHVRVRHACYVGGIVSALLVASHVLSPEFIATKRRRRW